MRLKGGNSKSTQRTKDRQPGLELKTLLAYSTGFITPCYIHHKRGVTEVWRMAHFWVSYGRCTMPGSDLWDGRKDPLDVGQVRCSQQETPGKIHHCMLL